MILDKWQEEVMQTKGNLVLRSGRQVGKSTVIALKAAKYALENQGKLVMIISRTERQAGLLFMKILLNIHEIAKNQIMKGKNRPTKSKISLYNKSVIHCLPAGDTGYGIMGFTIDLLIADEAAFIPEEVWASVTPALAITRGNIWLLSTPKIKDGYYYRCFSDPSFTAFHTSTEDCIRKDQIFLDYQKSWMTKAQYAQMYLGEFLDEIKQFFPSELIDKCCILPRSKNSQYSPIFSYFLGVDIARMGQDLSTFEILKVINKENMEQVENITTSKTMLTDTEQKILELDNKYNFGRKAIGIDDAGLGAGVLDFLLINNKMKRKVVGLSNARRSIDKDDRKKKLMKEDMYNNLKGLMERGEIKLLDDDEIIASLKSVQYDYNETGRMIIAGLDTHIAEGLIRAAFLAKNKGLNIMAFCK